MRIINVPKVLREKLGDEGVEALLQVLNLSNEDLKKDVITLAEEKFEKSLVEEISKFRVEVNEEISKLRDEIYKEISKLRAEFNKEISKLRAEFNEEISKLRVEFNEDISKLRVEFNEKISEVDKKISSTYANLIKWMFIFWLGQIGAILGILFAFFK